MSDHRVPLGRTGEAIAEEFLRRRGHTVLDRRFRTRRGEVDLVTQSGEHLYFVEVKTRAVASDADRFGGAFEALGWRKQRSMATLARTWIARHRAETLQPHLALLSVEALADRARVRFLPDPFEA
ncbi:MAG: YraN family protein [Deltaproteobacteria bacterium]|nr:YraN family protein [Deltaproteobacteria bacterium]